MTGEIPDEESKDTVSNKPAAKDKKNKMMDWIWKDSPITRIIEKFILAFVIVIGAYLISGIFVYPDFYIQPSEPSKTIKILHGEDQPPIKENFSIAAYNVYNWPFGIKRYKYPIYIYYDVIDDNCKIINNDDLKVTISPKNINTTTVSKIEVKLVNASIKEKHINLRFHGRGAGESLVLREGPLSTLGVSPSGFEPIRNCTVTIEIEEPPAEQKETQSASSISETRGKFERSLGS